MYKPEYYDLYMEALDEKYPDKMMLSKDDVIRFDGRSRNTVYRMFPEIKGLKQGISKIEYAMLLAKRVSRTERS